MIGSNRFSIVLWLAVAVLFSGCTSRTGMVRVFEGVELQIPLMASSEEVMGQNCIYQFLFYRQPGPFLDKAIENALGKTNGEFNALSDAVISKRTSSFNDCITIVGRPVLAKKLDTPDYFTMPTALPGGTKQEDWDF